MSRSRIWLSLTLASTTLLAACTTWAHQSGPPAQVVASHPGALVRVTRTDHSVITVRGAQIANDSLIGTTNDSARLAVAIPVDEIESVDTRAVSGARTAGLGVGAFVAVLAAVGIAAALALASLGGEL